MSNKPDIVDFELELIIAEFWADAEQVGQNFTRECWQVVNLKTEKVFSGIWNLDHSTVEHQKPEAILVMRLREKVSKKPDASAKLSRFAILEAWKKYFYL